MILLDTNIVSEVMKTRPAEAVLTWLNAQKSEFLFISAVTVGEITYGLRILPLGKRRAGLSERFDRFIELAFDQRVLAYDEAAARKYGDLMGERRENGKPMNLADGQIAATARTHGLAVATRNTQDFEGCGLDVINPFDPVPIKA